MAGPTTAGRRLGRYHLGDPLGGGPCGAVYRAKVYGVAGFERQFAVKRFHPALVALPIVSTRLSAAARAYGSLEHPRIARLHEYGIAAGEVFTATEMVAGLDVMRLVAATHGAGQPLPPGAALSLVTQAARAIGYAHGRGVNHLGLCPTNVIVTPEGDVKITDFGMLAQTLTMRPSDDDRLVHRIHYLAPEQLINEAPSAATDVFALGALLHELVTGEKAFVGVTALDVEHAVLSGHVREAGLPKAMARVLARCFARSPFERFPDARALADAIDAALRVAPVIGGRRELGGIVKDAVARLEAMKEGELSGAMVLAMPIPPSPPSTLKMGAVGRATTEAPTIVRDSPPSPTIRASAPPPSQTIRASAPPPVAPRQRMPERAPSISSGVPSTVASGMAQAVPRITRPMPPPVPPRPASIAPEDSDERTFDRAAAGAATTEPSSPSSPSMSPAPGPMPLTPSRMPNASPLPFSTTAPTEEPQHRPTLRLDSAWPTGEESAIPDGSTPLGGERPSEPMIEVIGDESEGVPVVPPLPVPMPHRPEMVAADRLVVTDQLPPVPDRRAAARRSSGLVGTLLFLLVCAALGIGAVLVWNYHFRERAEAVTAPVEVQGADVQGAPVQGAQAQDTQVQAAQVQGPVDAAQQAVEVDAGAAAVAPPVPEVAGVLVIESTPPGAELYVDGAEQGKTPAKLEASADRHSIAIVMPGHDLYTAEIDGQGVHHATLSEVSPPNGPAGIKVRCRIKGRYYVYVDGKPTGQLCPTERIGVGLGEHTVEVYDLVSEERRSYTAKVKQTRNSVRVKVDAD